jgi:ammonia channel protein AmtB
MLIAAVVVPVIYKMHYWVERKFKIDDAVGAVAVHGYAGFIGVVVAGFMLWGYPSSPNPDYAAINPLGNFIGAIIMFGVLGFLPGYVIASILKAFGMLRIAPEIEIMGLDISAYTTDVNDEQAIIDAEREFVNKL